MISEIFVRRPHLATVIAVVTTIAGLLSISVIPVAQYPDIVPPQVEVSTKYPGASAAVIEIGCCSWNARLRPEPPAGSESSLNFFAHSSSRTPP
jgi:hypothetical protein